MELPGKSDELNTSQSVDVGGMTATVHTDGITVEKVQSRQSSREDGDIPVLKSVLHVGQAAVMPSAE